MKPMNRRTALRGLAGTAIALPWLEAMERPGGGVSNAAEMGISASGYPKRLIVWTTHNGLHPNIWNPGGGETDFALRPMHAALEPFKKDMVIVAGLDNAAWYSPRAQGDTHSRGMCTFLSGTESIVAGPAGSDGQQSSKSSGGITVDQEIVKQLAPKTRFSSVEMTWNGPGGPYSTSSYLDAYKPLPGLKTPLAVFNRVFGDGTGGGVALDPAALAKLQAERKSILDAVGKTYQGMLPKLGAADRDKVDSHLALVRDLERRLAVPAAAAPAPGQSPGGAACPKTPIAPGATLALEDQGKAFVDLMATTIACDLSRVGTMQWGWTTNNAVYSFLGVSRGHHDMSHDGDDRADTVADLTKIYTYNIGLLAQLATRLKSIPEGNGTAFDNTVILHACDMARGNNGHTGRGLYHMLLGHAGGALKTGRLLRYPGTANNQLMVSLLNMFDIPATSFGNAALSQGALPRLL